MNVTVVVRSELRAPDSGLRSSSGSGLGHGVVSRDGNESGSRSETRLEATFLHILRGRLGDVCLSTTMWASLPEDLLRDGETRLGGAGKVS